MKRLWPIPEAFIRWFVHDEDGYALPMVLTVMTLLLTAGLMLFSEVIFSIRDSRDDLAFQKAVLAGKNAVETCKAKLSKDVNYSGTKGKEIMADGSSCRIKVQKISENKRSISIRTECGEYGRVYEGQAEIDPATGKIIKWTVLLKGW